MPTKYGVTLPDEASAILEAEAAKNGRKPSTELAAWAIERAGTGEEPPQRGGAREGAGRIGDAAKPKKRNPR